MQNHEVYCAKNPKNKHVCFGCDHLSVVRENNGEGFNEKTFTCNKLDKQLHSYKAEKIGHSCLSYTKRMPLECASFSQVDFFKSLPDEYDGI
jgi:hypothetical protein